MLKLGDADAANAQKRFNVFWVDFKMNHEDPENINTYYEMTYNNSICKKKILHKIDEVAGIDVTLKELKQSSNESFGKEIIYICSNDFALDLLKYVSD